MTNQIEQSASPPRRPYRPPIGIPTPTQNRLGSALASIVIHLLVLLLVIGPFWIHAVLNDRSQGAGGPGPAGGGGGGNRGTGGIIQERVRYVHITPAPPQQTTLVPVVAPPVIKPPEPEKPKVEPPKATPQPEAPKDASQAIGTGGGSGRDGSAGNGPGTGGGVGSGDGTGRGTGRGAGTGGGEGRTYPPTVTNLAILPIPVPSKVRPYKLIAEFEVDEKGNSRLLAWNPSKDGDYNRKVKAMLDEVRFRPAVKWDGTPVKDTTRITAEAP